MSRQGSVPNTTTTSSTANCSCGSVCWLCCGGLGGKVGESTAGSSMEHAQQPTSTQQMRQNGHIRPLRSWSSSEKRRPVVEESMVRSRTSPRRFSVGGSASGAISGCRSRGQLALHAWAEEDEMQQPISPNYYLQKACGDRAADGDRRGAGINSTGRHWADAGKEALGAKPSIPETLHNFYELGSSSSSSAPSSRRNIPGRQVQGGQYSISIPSMISSPLSFNQPFLASRTSMYGKHPPSSQIRAAHIDWDSLSMMEELGWNAPSSSRADWQVWRGPVAPSFAANGSTSGHGKAPKGSNPFMQQPQVAFTQQLQLQHQQQQYLHYLQHMQHISQQPHPTHQQHQGLQPQHQQSQTHQQPQTHQPTQPPLPTMQPPAHAQPQMAPQAGPNGAQQPIPVPGGHLFGDALGMAGIAEHGARSTPLSLLGERGQQLAWEYARQFHPILVSFSTASPHKLSVSWRWTLLFFLALSTLCVVVGVPVVLTILLRQEESFIVKH